MQPLPNTPTRLAGCGSARRPVRRAGSYCLLRRPGSTGGPRQPLCLLPARPQASAPWTAATEAVAAEP